MIRFTIGSNIVDLTLSEKTTITQPVYLFEFVNQITLKKTSFISADISAYPSRYNRFEIVNKIGPNNPLIGEADLTNEGYYFYSVFEQNSTSNLSGVGLNKVESGIAKVERTPIEYADYTSQNRTINVYDNNGVFLVDEDENFLSDENENYLL